MRGDDCVLFGGDVGKGEGHAVGAHVAGWSPFTPGPSGFIRQIMMVPVNLDTG